MFNLWITFFYLFVTDRAPLGNRPAQSFPVLLFGNSTFGKICTPEPFHWTRKHFYCVTHLFLCIAKDLELSQGLVLSYICHTQNTESSRKHSFNFQCTTLGREGLSFFFPPLSCKLWKWNEHKLSQGIKVIFIAYVTSLDMQDALKQKARVNKCGLV